MRLNYRVWEFVDESGTVYRVMPWSDSVATENIKPVADLGTTNYTRAKKKARELGYRLTH